MAVGWAGDAAQLNADVVNLCGILAQWVADVTALQEYVVGAGQDGLEADGFSTGDAQTITTTVSYLNTVAQIASGGAAQPTEFDFLNLLVGFAGPPDVPAPS